MELEEFGAASILAQELKSKWEAVDTLNSYIATLRSQDGINKDIIDTLESIAEDEMIHISQLEKVLPLVDIKAEVIADSNAEVKEEPATVVDEDEELILK